MNHNPTTRRYPRTMQEAFGPYTSHELYDPDEYRPPWRLRDLVHVVVCVAALIAIGVMLAWRG